MRTALHLNPMLDQEKNADICGTDENLNETKRYYGFLKQEKIAHKTVRP